jgi:hypothetical protein
MSEHMSNAEPAALKQRVIGKPFQPGQSGNPNGRPKGGRNRLSEQFVADLADTWQKHGVAALERCATESPDVFVRTIASLLPRDISIDVKVDVSEFANRFRSALAMLGNEPALPRPRRSLRVIDHD